MRKRTKTACPDLWQCTVVEKTISILVESKLSILHVLLDRVVELLSGNLELCAGPLGDLADKVVDAALFDSVQRHVMPKRDVLHHS